MGRPARAPSLHRRGLFAALFTLILFLGFVPILLRTPTAGPPTQPIHRQDGEKEVHSLSKYLDINGCCRRSRLRSSLLAKHFDQGLLRRHSAAKLPEAARPSHGLRFHPAGSSGASGGRRGPGHCQRSTQPAPARSCSPGSGIGAKPHQRGERKGSVALDPPVEAGFGPRDGGIDRQPGPVPAGTG